MKIFAFIILSIFAGTPWLGDFDLAKTQAAKEHKLILINFSGSDWCGPCIRLRKQILETPAFEQFASGHLVLLRADFPRQKKNQLDKAQVKRNEALAEIYNADGKFPFTLLVDEHGKVLRTWDGFPDEAVETFIAQLESYDKH